MEGPLGTLKLLAICSAMAVLLLGLGVLQYRWSTRVAAAEAQREREHLHSASSLFADRFDGTAGRSVQFLQKGAWEALHSGRRPVSVPQFMSSVYFLESSPRASAHVRRLIPAGTFVPAPAPKWAGSVRCLPSVNLREKERPGAAYNIAAVQAGKDNGMLILESLGPKPGECLAARIDDAYLGRKLIPHLIRESFGSSAMRSYDFAVVWRSRPNRAIYGSPLNADLSEPFFSFGPDDLPISPEDSGARPASGPSRTFVRHIGSTVTAGGKTRMGDLFGTGIWELEVAHKGVPLEAAFLEARKRDLLVSLGVEALLLASIVLLATAVHRTHMLSNQKMQFVAAVSHELRTPVSAIALLSRNQADGLVIGMEHVKQYGELIHEQSRRLNEMVEQTLEYAGIQSDLKRQAKEVVDLRPLVEDVVYAQLEELKRSGFEVEMKLDPNLKPVKGDARQLRMALNNLLSNARKHASSGSWVRVTAAYCAEQKEVRISVEDRGSGIDPAYQSEIFEPFRRGRLAMEKQIAGSGLGLSLARSAVEANRGRLTLASEAGRGSTFTIHLPV